MARPDDNANDIRELQDALADLRQEVSDLKSEAGPKEEEEPKKRIGGLLPGKNRAQTEAIRAAEAEAQKADPGQGKIDPLGGPGSDEFPGLDEFEENQARLRASRGAREDIENLPDKEVLEAQRKAKSALEEDFIAELTLPNIPHASSRSTSDLLTDAISAGAGKSEKPPQVPGQPGYINVKAENEDGECKIFKVIGHEEADCDGGTYEDNATVAMTNWWQPTFSLPGDTGYDQPTVTIGEGLNLIPAPADSSKLQPIQYWKREYFTPGEQDLETGGTTYFWVKQTFYTKYYLVSDKIVYCPSESAGTFIASPLGSTDAQFGDIKQKYWYSGVAKGTLTGNFAIVRKTSATQDDDTDTAKQQFLGKVTLDGDNAITSWEWRLNHAFNWQFPIYSVGTYGYTTAAGSGSGTTPPTYAEPTID